MSVQVLIQFNQRSENFKETTCAMRPPPHPPPPPAPASSPDQR